MEQSRLSRCNLSSGSELGLLVFSRERFIISNMLSRRTQGDGVSPRPDSTAGSARPLLKRSRRCQPQAANLLRLVFINRPRCTRLSVDPRRRPAARPLSPLYLPRAKDKSITYTSARHSMSGAPQAPLPGWLAGILKAPRYSLLIHR